MNATQDSAVKTVAPSSPLVADTATAEQRSKNRIAFQAKCDSMLYIVDFIATFHLRNAGSSKQTKKLEDVKSMVAQTRNNLNINY